MSLTPIQNTSEQTNLPPPLLRLNKKRKRGRRKGDPTNISPSLIMNPNDRWTLSTDEYKFRPIQNDENLDDVLILL